MTLDKPQLAQMLRTMILIREFDERAIHLRVAGKIYGAVHPYVGQEAVAAGACANLTVRDRVISTHRGHGHCIAKGADIRRMMAELFARVDIAVHAGVYDMPGVIVDGNDVLAVHATTGDAVARARQGDGPSLLECKTYRWRFHAMRATPPPETRPPEEIASWKARDPIR